MTFRSMCMYVCATPTYYACSSGSLCRKRGSGPTHVVQLTSCMKDGQGGCEVPAARHTCTMVFMLSLYDLILLTRCVCLYLGTPRCVDTARHGREGGGGADDTGEPAGERGRRAAAAAEWRGMAVHIRGCG